MKLFRTFWLTFVSIFVIAFAKAQINAPAKQWEFTSLHTDLQHQFPTVSTGEDWLYQIMQTSDGGFLAGGYRENDSHTDINPSFVKVNSNGQPIWMEKYDDNLSGLIGDLAEDDNYYIGMTGSVSLLKVDKQDGALLSRIDYTATPGNDLGDYIANNIPSIQSAWLGPWALEKIYDYNNSGGQLTGYVVTVNAYTSIEQILMLVLHADLSFDYAALINPFGFNAHGTRIKPYYDVANNDIMKGFMIIGSATDAAASPSHVYFALTDPTGNVLMQSFFSETDLASSGIYTDNPDGFFLTFAGNENDSQVGFNVFQNAFGGFDITAIFDNTGIWVGYSAGNCYDNLRLFTPNYPFLANLNNCSSYVDNDIAFIKLDNTARPQSAINIVQYTGVDYEPSVVAVPGGYVMAGNTVDNPARDFIYVRLVRFTDNGSIVWQEDYREGAPNAALATNKDCVFGLCSTDPDCQDCQGFAFCGNNDYNDEDYFIIKTGCQFPENDFIVGQRAACTFVFNATELLCEHSVLIEWDFGDGQSGYGAEVEHHYSGDGVYHVCVHIICCDGQVTTHCQDVSVTGCNNECFANAAFFITNDCGNVTYHNQTYWGGPMVTYLWDFGDGNYSSDENPQHAYTTTNPVQICLTVSVSFDNGTLCTSDQECMTFTPFLEADCRQHCTYTQGFYGNANAHTCDGSTTSLNLLTTLLATPLTSGVNANKLTIQPSEATCLIQRFPGGSVPSILSTGNYTCSTTPDIQSNGRFKSVLVAQTITLGLNLRLSPSLNLLVLQKPYMTTYAATACINGTAISGTQMVFNIPQTVLTYLGAANTVADLLALANTAIGGALPSSASIPTPPSLGDITKAVDAINKGFDKCRILAGFSSSPSPLPAPRIKQNIFDTSESISIIPNPNNGMFELSISTESSFEASLRILNTLGQIVATSVLKIEKGTSNLPYNLSELPAGIYFIHVQSENMNAVQRLVIQ